MTHIEYDEFGAYEETIDLVPVGTAQHRTGNRSPERRPGLNPGKVR